MCVFFKKVSLHLMHGMDVLDYRDASDSSRIALILSILAYKSAFYSMEDSSTGLFFFLTKLYINFKATEDDA